MSDLVKLEHILGIEFRNEAVYKEALTHKSFAAEHRLPYDNQRLELLGDAVVQIILTNYLYRRYTDLQEGDLTKIRSAMVNQDALAQFARDISLGSFLMLGRGELELNGQDRDSTISDAFESLIGAVYLDHGLKAATDLFLPILLKNYPDPAESLHEINPKGILQEYTQQKAQGVPQYRVVAVTGPAHAPQYEVEVLIKDKVIARGTASSHKLAEREAARAAVQMLLHHAEPQKDKPDGEE
jgi:ribonuclease-3